MQLHAAKDMRTSQLPPPNEPGFSGVECAKKPFFATTIHPEKLHAILNRLNEQRLRPAVLTGAWRDDLALEARWREAEGEMLEIERARVAARAREAPTSAAPFIDWFVRL